MLLIRMGLDFTSQKNCLSRSDHKGNKIKNTHIQTKRVYILRHSIDAKNVKKSRVSRQTCMN